MASEPKATLGEARDRFMREVWGEEWTRDRSGEPPAFTEILNALSRFERAVAAAALGPTPNGCKHLSGYTWSVDFNDLACLKCGQRMRVVPAEPAVVDDEEQG